MRSNAAAGSENTASWRALHRFAWVVFAAWVILSFSTKATSSDLWVHLKVGEDILAGQGIPLFERYSATAEGRPFVAYEWLSAVVFAWTYDVLGGPGLMLLRIAVGVGCLVLVYLSLAPATRRHPLILSLLMVVEYLICFRAYIRPHLFSLLIVSALCFALERWRRTRRLRDLIWLVPLHALWANLHGAFLFGVVVLAAVAVCVGLLVLFPKLDGERAADAAGAWSKADFARIAGVCLASLLVCLANPYGTAIFELSLRMSESSDFIKQAIWEWKSPFVGNAAIKAWFVAYCLALALLVFVALARIRERRWIDVALAFIVIFVSLRANRFVPYLGIFGLPIIARWLAEHSSRRIHGLRTWLCVGLIAFMLATAWVPKSVWPPHQNREFGWGFGGKLGYEAVEYIRVLGLEGVVFNEYRDGGLIIHALHPRVRPVMDPRIDLYGPEIYSEWMEARDTRNGFFGYLDRYDIDLVLLEHRFQRNRSVVSALERHPRWTLVKRFGNRKLFVRAGTNGR